MTRKRFVMLLMADSYSRNEANLIAAVAQSHGMNYSNAYKAESAMRGAIINFKNIDITAVCDAIRNIVDVAWKISSSMVKAAVAFVETYTKEMEVNHE